MLSKLPKFLALARDPGVPRGGARCTPPVFWPQKTRKSGVYLPIFFACKNVQILAFFYKIMAIFDQKLTKNGQKSTIFHDFENYVCRIAPCVFRCKPVKSGWEKPANLYSTKCRIFGTPKPPAGAAPWWLTTLPADHPPHPPVGPVRSSRSKIVPSRFFSKKFFFKKKFFFAGLRLIYIAGATSSPPRIAIPKSYAPPLPVR